MHRRKGIAVALAALAAATTLAACGGDDEEAAPPAPPPAEPAEPSAEPPAEPAAGGTTLLAKVGPGFDISLTTEDGQPVTDLPAGQYTIEVDDEADVHNFHLTGGDVDEATDVGEVETTEWTVDLAAGDYTFVCDPHAQSMNGSFTVS
jgi:hypothetical protein